jgi:hypothetical protein
LTPQSNQSHHCYRLPILSLLAPRYSLLNQINQINRLPTADCPLSTANCRLSTADLLVTCHALLVTSLIPFHRSGNRINPITAIDCRLSRYSPLATRPSLLATQSSILPLFERFSDQIGIVIFWISRDFLTDPGWKFNILIFRL